MQSFKRKSRRLHWRARLAYDWTSILMLGFVVASIAVLAVAHGNAVAAQESTSLGTAAGSELWMDGTSTVHDWECRTRTVHAVLTRSSGRVEPAGAAAIEQLMLSKGIEGLDVQIPVLTLHSDKKGLEKNMLKALKSERYPEIRFHMRRYTVVPAGKADTLALRIEGTLSVSGVQKDVTLAARAWKGDKGEWVEGTEALLMSEYGIKPPRMMLGTLKVADRVVIHYRLLLAPGSGVVGMQVPDASEREPNHDD